MHTKRCTKCKKELSLSNFHKDITKEDGRHTRCKVCRKEPTAVYNSTQRAKDLKKSANLKRDFGITLQQYDVMLESQNGVCAVCGQPETARYSDGETVKRLSVDHDHKTGRVRGLLCGRCNCALGYVDDSKERLLQLAIYLERQL